MTYSRRIINTKSKVLPMDYMNYVIHNPVESMWKKYIFKWLNKCICIVYRLREECVQNPYRIGLLNVSSYSDLSGHYNIKPL